MALRHGGGVGLMGGIGGDVVLPYMRIVHWGLQVRGKWVYERDAIEGMVKMVGTGVMKMEEGVGIEVVGESSLEEWARAFSEAEENSGMGKMTFMVP